MSPERRATIWLLLMCVLWGSSFFAMQLGEAGLAKAVGTAASPTAFLFLRFLVATALFPLVFPRVLRALTWRVTGYGLLLAVPFYAAFLFQVTGLQSTTPTVSAFITNLSVVLTPILGGLFFRERMRWSTLAGVAVALVGVFVMTNPAGGGFGLGEVLTLGCALAFSVQIQLTNIVTRRADPEGVTFVMFLAAVLFSGITLAAMGVAPGAVVRSVREPDVAWTSVYTAVACSLVAITILNRFQRDLAPTRAAVLYTMEPVFAAAFAAACVAEPMTARKILGGAIIVGGNLVCELVGRRTATDPAAEERR
jgi:drug/metabolite transporter (DMT)-like permease